MERAGGFFWLMLAVLSLVQIPLGGIFRTEVLVKQSVTGRFTDEVPFSESVTARHWLLGYVKGQQPDFRRELAKYERNGDEVSELAVITRHSWVDNLVTGATLAIYSPVTIELKGKIGHPVPGFPGPASGR